jgi:Alpha/beta hydrolase
VSTVTLAQLLSASSGSFDAAAQAWRALSDDLDRAGEDLVRGTQDLEHAWPRGAASQSAYTATAAARGQLSDAYNPARRIYQALDRHASTLASLRARAESHIDGARRGGFTVDVATGAIIPPEAKTDLAADSLERRALQIAHELSELVAQAQALDDSTANAINVNLPDRATGFGQQALPPISRDDLLAQRGRSPQDVNAWWKSLTPEQQQQLIRDHPDLVGSLNGVPCLDRDQANRAVLLADRTALQQREDQINQRLAWLHDHPGNTDKEQEDTLIETERLKDRLARIEADKGRLDKLSNRLDSMGGQALLLGLDPTGDGQAIVAVGNPDTAAHTAVLVPGVSTNLGGMSGQIDRANQIRQASDVALGTSGQVAVVAWLGYDPPQMDQSLPTAVLNHRAEAGGVALDGFVDGLRATHGPGSDHITAIGHSYGSSVLGEAASHGRHLAVDDMVTAGSPGMDVDHAGDLNVNARHVWVGAADDDPVANPAGHAGYVTAVPVAGPWIAAAEDGIHGPPPQDGDFGANRYHVDTHGHSGYWDQSSQSLANQAYVVTGQYGRVGLDHGSPPS